MKTFYLYARAAGVRRSTGRDSTDCFLYGFGGETSSISPGYRPGRESTRRCFRDLRWPPACSRALQIGGVHASATITRIWLRLLHGSCASNSMSFIRPMPPRSGWPPSIQYTCGAASWRALVRRTFAIGRPQTPSSSAWPFRSSTRRRSPALAMPNVSPEPRFRKASSRCWACHLGWTAFLLTRSRSREQIT